MPNNSDEISTIDPAIDSIDLIVCTLVAVADDPDSVNDEALLVYDSLVERLKPKALDGDQFIGHLKERGLKDSSRRNCIRIQFHISDIDNDDHEMAKKLNQLLVTQGINALDQRTFLERNQTMMWIIAFVVIAILHFYST